MSGLGHRVNVGLNGTDVTKLIQAVQARVWETWDDVDMAGLLTQIGEDIEREGLQDTPRRIQKAWLEMLRGHFMHPAEICSSVFDDAGTGYQLARDINFVSVCEHHLLPFYGKAQIGYIPGKKGVLGLSKLARLVECYACRLQNQERITDNVADAMMEYLRPQGVVVILDAQHFCCKGRGVKQVDMHFQTIATRGEIDHSLMQLLLSSKQ